MSFHAPNQYRVRDPRIHPLATDDSYGNNGFFIIPASLAKKRPQFAIQVSDGEGWEHVSISLATRCPTWEEMCYIKNLFWDPEDCVMQLHPPRSKWVSFHPYCLHLWRPIDAEIPQPPMEFVGPV